MPNLERNLETMSSLVFVVADNSDAVAAGPRNEKKISADRSYLD